VRRLRRTLAVVDTQRTGPERLFEKHRERREVRREEKRREGKGREEKRSVCVCEAERKRKRERK
jgi:hypothetical protein